MLVTATKVFSLTTILVVAIGVVTMAPLTALGAITEEGEGLKPIFGRSAASPSVVTGDNIYLAWWTWSG